MGFPEALVRAQEIVQSQSAWEIIRDHPSIRILLVLGAFCKQVNKCTPVIFRHAPEKSRDWLLAGQEAGQAWFAGLDGSLGTGRGPQFGEDVRHVDAPDKPS